MRKLNLIVVFNEDLSKCLFCIRAKEPYRGLYNFVGGKVEENESNDEAAYRELFEETGISTRNIELDHFMDLNYFKYGNNLQVYYGILKHEVNLVEEKNKLEWVVINDGLLDNSKFAGNYNVPHIIKQIKVYLRSGTDIDKYQPGAILVVNTNNYIGKRTNLETDYAKKLEKEIIYYTDLIKNNQSDNLQFIDEISLEYN